METSAYILKIRPEHLKKHESDLNALAAAATQEGHIFEGFDSGFFVYYWSSLLNNRHALMYGCFSEHNKMVGLIAGVLAPDPFTGAMSLYYSVWFVLPEYRSLGFKMYEALENAGKARGAKRAHVGFHENTNRKGLKMFLNKKGYTRHKINYYKEF